MNTSKPGDRQTLNSPMPADSSVAGARISPVSFSQQRLWLLDRLLPLGSVYNLARMARLNGVLDVDALRQALNEVVRRHQVLRSQFAVENGAPVQVIVPELTVALEVEDLSALPEGEREQEAQQQAQDEARAPFDLERGPLVRARLLRLGEREHWLLLTFHHIVSDDWSLGVLWRELSTLYDVHRPRSTSLLAELPVQYADYARWQREWLKGAVLERQLAYWKQALAELSVLRLPTDRVRPAQPSYRGRRLAFALGDELIRSLRALGRREGTTLFTTLLAALQVLLYRYTGQEDVAVGVPVAGRRRPDIEGLIGFFVNTLVLRGDLSGEPSFRDYLDRVRLRAQEAYENQDVPFEKLVEELHPKRDASRNPLFQVLLNKWSPEGQVLRLNGLEPADVVATDTGTAKFDLEFVVVERQGQCQIRVEYATDLFDAATIERLAGHFTTLLEAIVADPEQRIGQLPLLTAAERHQLLVERNDTAADYPRDRCIHQLLEEQAARTPEAVAVVFEDRQLTYAELNARANQLAHHLIALGVGPEVLVGICLERSLELIVGLLGILKAGGAYVPLDPSYPKNRLAFMLKDTRAPVLLTQQSLLSEWSAHCAQTVCLDRDWTIIASYSDANLPSNATATNLAYVIYTSGSTGSPKGVMMPHRPICHLTWWQIRTSAMPRGARTLQLAPAGFDVSVQEIFSTLCAGGTLVLISDRVRRHPTELLEVIEDASVARLFLTFTALQQLAETAIVRQRAPRNLREVITAGEQLRITPAIAHWFDTLPDCRLCNQYGPTETHVVVTHSALEGPSKSWPVLPPIGRPISNSRIYVLDDDLCPVSAGATGEIVIGGDCLARGYLNRPELTAERFVADPFCGEADARMYRSGDFGSFRDDGSIEFQGRRDHQVKVRGFRIEIGEVEAALDQHPDVVRAAVTVYEPDPGDRRLVAYVETRSNLALGADVLRAFLLDKLPEHMVPVMFVQLATLPISPTGKIDRQALPPPSRVRPQMATEYIAPSAPLDHRLLEIWQDLLGLSEIGIDDNFFALGGDSLTATRLLSRVGTELGRGVTYRALFSNPTIRGLANLLARTPCETAATDIAAAMPDASRESTPATAEQEAIWLAASLQPELPVYSECFAVHFNGRVDPDVLQSALNALIVRHDILRTGFAVEAGQVIQKVAREAGLTLTVVDVTRVPAGEAWKTAVTAAESAARRIFDLARPPLVRGVLARMPDAADVLFLVMHHLVIDAFGFYHVLVPELAALYEESGKSGGAAQLEPLPIQFSDFARSQQRQIASANRDELRAFWRTQLADLVPLELPADRTRPLVRSFRGEFLTFSMATRTISALKELAASEGTTFFTALVAAFKVLLYRYTGQEDIGSGTVDAGRIRPEHDRLLGCCLNTLILRTRLDADLSFRDLLRRVRDTTASVHEHKEFSFREIGELLPQYDAIQRPPVPVVFVMEPSMPDSASGWSVSQHDVQTGTAKFDLMFEVEERGSGLIGRVEYATDLFDRARIERMVGHWRVLLEAIVADPEQRIGQLPLLTPAERHQLLVEWNDTAVDYPKDRCIHELFEEQVARNPAAVAVVFEDRQLTYGELNARANRLAHHLIGLGVGPEVLVGICLERSLELIVGLLGILKAGGAYVPLDPSYPQARLAFMLKDAAALVLLTQQELLEQLPQFDGRILCLDRDWKIIAAQPDTHPPCHATAENLAYVIYTSGSTGTPKGVMVTHGNVVRLFSATEPWFDFGERDTWTCFHSFAFDFSVWEIWGALIYGGRLVMVLYVVSRDPDAFHALLRRERVTVLNQTPSAFRQLMAADARVNVASDLVLRLVIFGGEALEMQSLRPWFDRHGDAQPQLVNMYGITETTVHVTYRPIRRTDLDTARGSMIGVRIPDLRVYILDRHLQPVPMGVAGEIVVGGAGVARGYLNRAELTAERFVADPFTSDTEARLYRSGDLARRTPSGDLEYLGRIDQQVKISGFRIELGEIEAVLARHAQVREAVVLLREDTPGDTRLVAYVVAQAEALAAADLRAFLKQHLPDYMVPAAFVPLPALPLTPNGKIDRQALPVPAGERADLEVAYAVPRTPTESRLAEIWQEVLGLTQVGTHDDFFEVGGHSLKATQLMSRIHQVFGVELPLRRMFEAPTVAALAGDIDTAVGAEANPAAPRVVAVAREREMPLSFAQRRLWFLEQLAPEGAVYNIAHALRLEGELNTEALEAGLNTIVARHEVLRTTFVEHGGEPVQVIAPELSLALAVDDLSVLPAEQRNAASRQRAQDAAQTRFDLERGPLLRASLLRLGERLHVLVLVVHHIVADGWSMAVLLRELSASYEAFVKGQTPPLAALPLQYVDYAMWQRELLKGETLARQLDYWTGQLAGVPILRLPTDQVRPVVQRFTGARTHLQLSAKLTHALKRLSEHEGGTLFMTLLAAFQVLLARHSGQEDIAVGAPIAGRTRRETEGLIGFFVNTLVLRTDVSGNPSFRALLKRVREVCLGAYAHQELPFENLVEVLNPARDLSHHPLFDVMLNLVEGPEDTLELSGLISHRIALDTAFAKFAMTLYVEVEESGTCLNLVYQNALFSAERMAQLLEQYHHLLAQIAEAPQNAILSYSLITPTWRARLPDPSAVIHAPPQTPVTQLFGFWAERQPEAIAVTQGAQQWSYRELADAANRLAQSLASRGIGRGDVVAILGQRSFGLVSSLLGVWLSGGVFLTVDSLLPVARQRVMLREAGAKAICRIGASPLPGGLSEADVVAAVFEVDPARGIVASAGPDQRPNSASLSVLDGDQPAYVFFTSGSTGVPKGVLGCHKGLTHFLDWQREAFGIGPSDRVAQLTSLSFDVLLRDVFLPLTSGGTLCIPEDGDHLDIVAWLERQRVTVVHTVPTLLQSWLAQPSAGVGLRALRWLFVAGEPLSGPLVQAWRDSFPNSAEVVNLYGPTETTLVKCFHRITGAIQPGLQPVGVALPQTQALVLNAGGQPCGIGELGEVVLRTPFRTLGYINAPQEMRARFVPNPFRDDPNDLLYYTGDRGRYRMDGTLDLVGRLDDQVKIRGVRVEPGEVAAVLGGHPAVQACVVVGQKDERGEGLLVAYVVATPSQGVTSSELRSFLGGWLPAVMVPSEWLFLDDLPRLSNGKVDRSALPAPSGGYAELGVAYVAPRTPTESRLVEIWQEVLGVARVGISDNFFEVGGHSLKAMQLMSRIHQVFGVELPLRRMFEAPTIAELAVDVARMGRGPGETALERILREVEALTDEETAHQLDGNGSGG